MPSALEFFEKCAGARLDNYVYGGSGMGAGSDLALHGSGVSADELDPKGLEQARHRGRALEAIGSIGLGALGAAGVAAYHHPVDQWFDSWDHAGNTMKDFAAGSSAGFIGGVVPSAIKGRMDTNALIEEAKQRRARGDQAADLPPTNVNTPRGAVGPITNEVVPQT